MPYVMLQGIRKKAKQREERREAMEAESGIVTGKADGFDRRKSKQTTSGRSSNGSSGRGAARRAGSSANGSGYVLGLSDCQLPYLAREFVGVRGCRSLSGVHGVKVPSLRDVDQAQDGA